MTTAVGSSPINSLATSALCEPEDHEGWPPAGLRRPRSTRASLLGVRWSRRGVSWAIPALRRAPLSGRSPVAGSVTPTNLCHGERIESAYIELRSGGYDAMLLFAKKWITANQDKNRRLYELMANPVIFTRCREFTRPCDSRRQTPFSLPNARSRARTI